MALLVKDINCAIREWGMMDNPISLSRQPLHTHASSHTKSIIWITSAYLMKRKKMLPNFKEFFSRYLQGHLNLNICISKLNFKLAHILFVLKQNLKIKSHTTHIISFWDLQKMLSRKYAHYIILGSSRHVVLKEFAYILRIDWL